MLKVVPLPNSLSTSIQPWCCLTMPKTVARPRPVPFPSSLVVKNGSKMRARLSGGMPVPVSAWLNQTDANSKPSAPRHGVAGVDGQVHQDLFHHARIRLDVCGFPAEMDLERDILAEQP